MIVRKSANRELESSNQQIIQNQDPTVVTSPIRPEFVSSGASLAARAYAMPQIHQFKSNYS
jgi:hypothetical protein